MATPRPATPCLRALVIFEYELLGEGIAALLRGEGLEVEVVRASDTPAVVEALGSAPCLVVAERATDECQDRIRRHCPQACIVDISRVVGRGFPDAADVVDFSVIQAALTPLRTPALAPRA